MSDETAEMSQLDLPPGFRFHPTDEEVVSHYLTTKVLNHSFSCEPWGIPSKAKMGEKEWYFLVHKERKYPTRMRTNRATESGYRKATGRQRRSLKQIHGWARK